MSESKLIPGYATPDATRAYAEQFADVVGDGHFSEFVKTRIQLSTLGVGTFPGEASDEQDSVVGQLVNRALRSGINVVDTGAHYRYGRALAAVGAGVRAAVDEGVSREAMFLVSKGGFLTLRGGPPEDIQYWFDEEIERRGLGTRDDLAKGVHLLTPEYIDYQLDLSRTLMGVETLDAFLVDQPEIHIPEIGKEKLNQKLLRVFEQLERAVQQGRLRYYGISTFDSMRVETDNPLFQSLTSMLGLAEKSAQAVQGKDTARHHFRLITVPFNQVMTEAFTRFSQATGEGNIASTLQAAYQLKVYVMASHTLFKGHLGKQGAEDMLALMPGIKNHAQSAIQFNRSTPGIGTTLVGMHHTGHMDDLLSVSRLSPLTKQAYLRFYQRA